MSQEGGAVTRATQELPNWCTVLFIYLFVNVRLSSPTGGEMQREQHLHPTGFTRSRETA